MSRFNRPRLVTEDDPAYQRHVAQMVLQRANQRAIRPPSRRDIFGGEVETLLRAALAARFGLSERRILEYEQQIGRSWQRKYRELDALVIDGQTRVHVFEIKASRRAGALHRALRQLADTQAILKLAFHTVSTTILLVDTGIITSDERNQLAMEDDTLERLPQTLDEAVTAHPEVQRVTTLDELRLYGPQVELLVLSVDDLIALADGAPLTLDWEVDDEEIPDVPPPTTTPLYSTPDDEDDNPFAAAFRKAGKRNKNDAHESGDS